MRHNKTKQLYNYWMDLFWAEGNLAGSSLPPVWPQRSDVHPSACRSLLGDMFILEIGSASLTYRLAGTRLCALYGHELKGESFGSTFTLNDRDAAMRWASRTGTENYVAVMSGTAVDTADNNISLETLLMPVACNGKRAIRILGLTVACDAPVTIGNRAVDNQTIRSVRTLRPWENENDGYTISGQQRGVRGTQRSLRTLIEVGETPPMASSAGMTHIPPQVEPRQIAHLRVYEGGRTEN